MNKLLKYYTLGTLGGLIYVFIELMWRGYSHWAMFFVGGLAFLCVGAINEIRAMEFSTVEINGYNINVVVLTVILLVLVFLGGVLSK